MYPFGDEIVLYVLGLLAHMFASYVLGELASRAAGSKWVWIPLFFFIPVISHGFFLFVWRSLENKRKSQKVLGILVSLAVQPAHETDGAPVSVTPFDAGSFSPLEPLDRDIAKSSGNEKNSLPPFPEVSSTLELKAEIFQSWRDKEIEKLMESNEWEMAFQRGERKLKSAAEFGDNRTVSLYNAYLSIIKNHIVGECDSESNENPPDEGGVNVPKITDSFI